MTDKSFAGQRFGGYEILEELGSGGMGRVYRAKNITLERVVALKMLAPAFSVDQDFVARFLKEARSAARLNHPNIVQIYDFGNVEGIYYLAMEYVNGESLRAYVKRQKFTEKSAIAVVREAVRALGVAHAEGIVHRDIKPDNIMLTTKGELKLVDLGIAKRLDEDQDLTQTGQAVGTPQYISPEQIRGLRVDARADIYSLGATFYHLLTGRPPYKGTSAAVVMTLHLTEPLPDPRTFEPSLSQGVCRVLRKMLAKERDERYSDVAALDRDLYKLQLGQTPEPEEPSETAIATAISASGPSLDIAGTPPPFVTTPAGSPPQVAVATPPPTTPRPTSAPTTASPPTAPPSSSSVSAASFREEDLRFIETELAKHIGPLARVLVKKAAKTAANLSALATALVDNIPEEEGRRAFRTAIRARAK
ncbi:MAG TPA: serine/threonine-protein kinase [Thermoanaerobaculia bacterium]